MASLRLDSTRRAFLRGEEAVLDVVISGVPGASQDDVRLHARVGDAWECALPVPADAGGDAVCRFRLDTALLKAGEYALECRLIQRDEALCEAEFPLWIARRWNPDRMRVWLWPHTKFGVYVQKLDDLAREEFAWYADIGVNSFQPYGDLDEDKFRVFDYALVNGWEMGVRLRGGLMATQPYATATGDEKGDTETPHADALYKVERDQERYDAFHPAVVEEQNESNRRAMEVVQQFPHVRTAFYNSELGDPMLGVETPLARRHYTGELRTVPHAFVLPGVIPDDDEGYVEWLYLCKWGDGYTAASERVASMARAYVPEFMPFYDPHRSMACYERFRGSAFISTWTYTNPDPKITLYIETLVATARYTDQGVLHTVTLLNYPGTIFPQDKGWTVMGADRLVETSWINLSRRPDGLGLYLSSDCDPIDTPPPPEGKAWWSPDQREPYQRNAATFEAFAKFTSEVVQPYGPMIGKLRRSARKVAVLSSESSRVYSDSPALVGHYNNLQVYCFYTVMNMAHVAADVIFDETVTRHGLDEYDAVVLPKCDTLTQSVYDRVVDFARRGGLVISDQYLRAPVPDVVRFDFDFEYRDRISANAIVDGEDYVRWDDQLDVKNSGMKQVAGVTAEDDQKILEQYAAEFRERLDGRMRRDIDCSSPTALLNLLERGSARYLFIVNDKRTYGERVGAHKAMLDKAVPQSVTITVNEWAHGELHAYDLLERKRIEVKVAEGARTFDVDLPAPGGKIIALLPKAIGGVKVEAPESMGARGVAQEIHVTVTDADSVPLTGAQPVRLTITDPNGNVSEFSDYYAAESGRLTVAFTPAANDAAGQWHVEAEELMSGLRGEAHFTLTP